MRIRGERLLRKSYTVQKMGGSRGIVLSLDFDVQVGDIVRQYLLPDGSLKVVRTRRGEVDSNARAG